LPLRRFDLVVRRVSLGEERLRHRADVVDVCKHSAFN
jgi:hypothetical protein